MTADIPLLGGLRPSVVWESESNFVGQWLTQPANLTRLGELAGVDLSFLGVEVPTAIGPADLVCMDEDTGTPVVVEAQLNRSDYDHVGRLLAYCVDLDARLGVLVAGGSTPALCALIARHNSRWRAQCRLRLVELAVWGDHTNKPCGVTLRRAPATQVAAAQHQAPAQNLRATVALAYASRKALASLAMHAPPPSKAKLVGSLVGLPKPRHKATGALTIATWSANADFALLARTLAHVAATQASTLLVLLEKEQGKSVTALSKQVVYKLPLKSRRMLATLLCCVDSSLVVDAQTWDWELCVGNSQRLTAHFARLDGVALALPVVERHRMRRRFWRALGVAVQAGTTTRMRPTNLLASSSWQLAYALVRNSAHLAISLGKQQRFVIDLRLFSVDGGLVDSWFEQLLEQRMALEVQLGDEFKLHWLARGSLLERQALVRCIWQTKASAPTAFASAMVAQLAPAVLRVERVLLAPVQQLENYVW